MTEEKVGFLGEEALKRKERLAALKRKKDDIKESSEEPATKLLKPKFRSYKPQDENLKENMLKDAKPGDVEAEVQDLITAAKSKVDVEDLNIENLTPRKQDWDLNRDVTKKAEKLERRTQKSIAELIVERLKSEGNRQDIATAVRMAPEGSSQDD